MYAKVPRGSVKLHRRLKNGPSDGKPSRENLAISVKPHRDTQGQYRGKIHQQVKIRRDYTPNPDYIGNDIVRHSKELEITGGIIS